MDTNRYGDMLKDVLSGLQGVDPVKVDTLQQEMNELWMRETKYKSWLRLQDNKIGFNFLDLPFEPIYSTVLENDKSELVIPIPSKYKNLFIMGQGRINGSGGQAAVFSLVQFNGDTGSNYDWGHMLQNNTTISGGQDMAATSIPFVYMIADGWAAGPAGNAFMFIPHYTSSYYKNILIVGSVYGTNTSTAVRQGNWESTSPLEEIRIFPDPAFANAKIESGSLISIYGIF